MEIQFFFLWLYTLHNCAVLVFRSWYAIKIVLMKLCHSFLFNCCLMPNKNLNLRNLPKCLCSWENSVETIYTNYVWSTGKNVLHKIFKNFIKKHFLITYECGNFVMQLNVFVRVLIFIDQDHCTKVLKCIKIKMHKRTPSSLSVALPLTTIIIYIIIII